MRRMLRKIQFNSGIGSEEFQGQIAQAWPLGRYVREVITVWFLFEVGIIPDNQSIQHIEYTLKSAQLTRRILDMLNALIIRE